MIVTVTPNPTIDQTYWVTQLNDPQSSLLTRAERTLTLPGGKGINVSLLLGRLGVETMAMGILAGYVGQTIEHLLRGERVTTNFVWTDGESRTNVTVIEQGKEVSPLEVNAAGPEVSVATQERFLRRYRNALRRAHRVLFGGSLPLGLPDDFYRALIEQAHAQGIQTALNASDAPFERACELGPWLSKPDIRERSEVLGRPVRTCDEALAVGKELLQTGSQIVVIAHDLAQPIAHQLVLTREGAWDFAVREVKMVNRVGVGDAFLGGLLYGLERGRALHEAGRYGMAAAIASAEAHGTVTSSRSAIERALTRVEEVST